MTARESVAPSRASERRLGARERVLAAAYELFNEGGTREVGVDAIVRRSGVAKMSLYHHFRSKQGLVAAFLEQHEKEWTTAWLKSEVCRRARSPAQRLLAVFDAFSDWFRSEEFAGCPFVRVLLEYPPGDPSRRAAIKHLANIRAFLRELAVEAGVRNSELFAGTWQIMMKGAMVSACEGDLDAAHKAKVAAAAYLQACLSEATR
jgi:AcrR family transcriptional regulator